MFNFFTRKREPQPLFFTTDVHCHVLPGIDDGSPDAATSLSLVERMSRWGLKRIVASPHVTFGTFPNTPQTVATAMKELKAAMTDSGIEGLPSVEHWAEYRIDDLLLEHIEKDMLMTSPEKFILIENSFMQEPWNLDQLVFDLQVKGLRPVLAHPERYSYYYNRRERYRALHEAGLLFQCNVLSLAGAYGGAEKNIAELLIADGLVDFLGTDLHRARHADAIDAYLASKDYEKHRKALDGRLLNDR